MKSECCGIVNCDFPSYPWNIIKNMFEFYGIYSMYCATPLAFENLGYFFIRMLLPNNNVDGKNIFLVLLYEQVQMLVYFKLLFRI